jgi:hypothetical protein
VTGESVPPPGPDDGTLEAEPPAVAPAGDRLELVTTSNGQLPAVLSPGAAVPLPDGFRILRAEELTLTADAARLRRLNAYRVLGHVGWAQTGVDENRAVRVDLKHLGITNPGGTIGFYLGRFRHAIVDLEYLDGGASLWSAGDGFGLEPFEFSESYRLHAVENDIRSVRYVDHPLFGLLIMITPAPQPVDTGLVQTGGGPAA